MKKLLQVPLLAVCFLFLCSFHVKAEKGNYQEVDSTLLATYEDSLKNLAFQMIAARKVEDRKAALKLFQPYLKEALAVTGSFHYPFDSLTSISFTPSPDNSFRIITWQLCINSNEFEYFGFLQMNTPDLNGFDLEDESADIRAPELEELDSENWYGALYYNIHEVGNGNKKYYLLFGFDANDLYVRRKLIDVLKFEDGEPVFGAPVFHLEEEGQMARTVNRFMLEYSASSAIRLNYDEEYKKIIYDNLIPFGGLYDGEGVVMVPDGSYRGFELKQGEWHSVEKVFNDFQEEAPRPFPVLDGKPKGKESLFGPDKKEEKDNNQ